MILRHRDIRLGELVARLRGFRFRRHHHYNLPADRIALIERFLQKRVEDILRYFEKADECLQIPPVDVGVISKSNSAVVGDEELHGDLQLNEVLNEKKEKPKRRN